MTIIELFFQLVTCTNLLFHQTVDHPTVPYEGNRLDSIYSRKRVIKASFSAKDYYLAQIKTDSQSIMLVIDYRIIYFIVSSSNSVIS